MNATLKVKKIAQLTGHNASVFSLCSGPGKGRFLSGDGDGWIASWDLDHPENGHLLARIGSQIFSLLYLEEWNKVVAGNMNGGVHWLDLDNPENNKNVAHHRKGVFDILRIKDSIFTLGGDGVLTRWSIPESRTVESYQLSNLSLRSLDFCPVRNEIAVGASDNAIYLLNASTLEPKKNIMGAHFNSVFTVKYSHNGKYLLSGGRDAHLRIWDLDAGGKQIYAQPAHWFTINSISLHPQEKWFATASRDKTIKIWDAGTFQLLKVLDTGRNGGHINSVNRLLWSPYQDYLISCSADRRIVIWKIAD